MICYYFLVYIKEIACPIIHDLAFSAKHILTATSPLNETYYPYQPLSPIRLILTKTLHDRQ